MSNKATIAGLYYNDLLNSEKNLFSELSLKPLTWSHI